MTTIAEQNGQVVGTVLAPQDVAELTDRHAVSGEVLSGLQANHRLTSWDRGQQLHWVSPEGLTAVVKRIRPANRTEQDTWKVRWPTGQTLHVNTVRWTGSEENVLLVEGFCQQLAAASWVPGGFGVLGMNGCDGVTDKTPQPWAKGRHIWLSLDADQETNDRVGKAVERVTGILARNGALSVRLIDNGGTEKDGLDDVLNDVRPERRTAAQLRMIQRATVRFSTESTDRLRVTKASEIQIRVTKWLWDKRAALGTLTLLAGREGIGKSTVALTLGAMLTRGTLPGSCFGTPRSIVIVATEDTWEETIVPRLIAAGADLDRVLRVEAYSPDGLEEMISLPADLPQLRQVCVEEQVALIILDPLMSTVGQQLDTHKDHEIRRMLDPLVKLAGSVGASVVGLIHFNKTATTDPLNAVMGSKAFAAVARAVLVCVADPDDKERFLLGNPKNNLGRSNLPSLAYKIAGACVGDTEDGPVWSSRIEWLGEEEQSVREVLEATATRSGTSSVAAECAGWLRDYLTDAGGAVDLKTITAAAEENGYSPANLRRAREKGKIVVTQGGFPKRSVWGLPSHQTVVDPTDATDPTVLTDPTDANGQRGTDTPSVESVTSVGSAVRDDPTVTPLGDATAEERGDCRICAASGNCGRHPWPPDVAWKLAHPVTPRNGTARPAREPVPACVKGQDPYALKEA